MFHQAYFLLAFDTESAGRRQGLIKMQLCLQETFPEALCNSPMLVFRIPYLTFKNMLLKKDFRIFLMSLGAWFIICVSTYAHRG